MTTRIVLAIVAPVLAVLATEVTISKLRRRPEVQRLPQSSTAFRPLRGAALVIILAYFVVLAIGPAHAWDWYSSTIHIVHRDLALGIAGIAITAWSGCLIAFVVRQRLTPELSRGLRFIVYAIFTPLVALTGSGVTFRTAALAVAMSGAFWTMLQFRSGPPKLKMDFKTSPLPGESNGSPGTATPSRRAMYVVNFVRDRFAETLFGWQWSALLCVLALAVLVRGTEWIIVGCSLIALLAGMTLAFVTLVVPSTDEPRLTL